MAIGFNRYEDDIDYGASWNTSSEIDPRFNMSGECNGIWDGNEEVQKAVEIREKQLKCKAPKDLVMTVMKY